MGPAFTVLKAIWKLISLINIDRTPKVPTADGLPKPMPTPEPIAPEPDYPSEEIAKAGFSKSIDDHCPELAACWRSSLPVFIAKYPQYSARLDYTWRGSMFQFELYKKGRKQDATGSWVVDDPKAIVTKIDGIHTKSFHQPYKSLAFDYIIFRGKTAIWADSEPNNELYRAFGRIMQEKEPKAVSGALWANTWKDPGHTQLGHEIV